MKFYKNGENTDTFTPNPFVNIPMTTTDLTIGNNFTGELDNVMIHKGVVDFTVETQLYTVPDSLYTPQTITTESWTHVAAVYNKEQNMVSMYQDGQHTGSFENYLTDFTAVGTNSNSMFIGTTGDSTTFYDGILDDVRVYKSALTTEDIGELYAMYDQNVISYIDKTSISPTFVFNETPSIYLGTLNVGSLGDMESLRYYAFAMDTNRLSGKQDMQYFIDNIDSIPTTFYKTSNTVSASWDVGTLNKVISSDLVTEADVSLKTSVYVYVIAQNTTTYEIDYYKQQIHRTFEPVSISSIDAEIVGDNTQITILSGTAISIKQYYIFAFNGQVTQEEVISFAKTRLNVINETGMTNINGHDVYSYKVPGSIPTPGGYNIPTNIVLSNAFYSLTNVTAPIPVSGLTPFTTYLVGYDNSGSYYVNPFEYTPVQGVTTTLVEQLVTYETNLPTTLDGITLNTGTLLVGTQKAITKIVLFAFAGVEPSEDEVVLFYQDNIRNLSVSTEYVYINTTGFNLGQTIDLSTLGVSVTSVFDNLSVSSTEAIVDGGEYYVIMLLEDVNGGVSINVQSSLITSPTIVSQRDYYSTNDMSKALDGVYTGGGIVGWIAGADSSHYIWGWLDLGTEYTINKIRLWQNGWDGMDGTNSYPEERYIGDFSLTMTNDVTNTSDDSYSTNNFVKYSTDSVIWKYANASGELVVPSGADTFGGVNDPTKSILRSATSGFHEFTFTSSGTGRYLLFQGWAVSRLARLNELQIYGY